MSDFSCRISLIHNDKPKSLNNLINRLINYTETNDNLINRLINCSRTNADLINCLTARY